MEIKKMENGTALTLAIEGYLDTRTAKEADVVFQEAAKDYEEIILDLAGTSYISSAGIRILRKLQLAMYKKGGRFSMIHLGEEVTRVLEMTGLLDLLKLS
ncbi:MAG: STAS domain-containing protein [Lachnospiraceae bacterium]|nr:STAS domain-containing protein [Lachnospiraceae bacterium]